MTHKKTAIPPDPVYIPLHVGRELGDDLGFRGDNSGDNISKLNPLFGELTGIYWVWKNDLDTDVLGICHYRRFFMNEDKKPLCKSEIIQLLSDHDIITSTRPFGTESSYVSFASSHNIKDYDILGESIHRMSPEYDRDFTWFKDEHAGCFGNLSIMPRGMFSEYCAWMFSILFDASEYIDVSGYDLYHRRVYGFLSEVLLNIWIHHNAINAYECPIMFTSEKAETVELKRAISTLVRETRISEARSLYYDITRIRPDVTLPESDISGELLLIEQILYIMEHEISQGIPGLLAVSNDLSQIITYYRSCIKSLTESTSDMSVSDFDTSSPVSDCNRHHHSSELMR